MSLEINKRTNKKQLNLLFANLTVRFNLLSFIYAGAQHHEQSLILRLLGLIKLLI